MTTILLYEDTAGQLYLFDERRGRIWFGLHRVESGFHDDAQALDASDGCPWDWRMAHYPSLDGLTADGEDDGAGIVDADLSLDQLEAIAVWMGGTVLTTGRAGDAARRYLGLCPVDA